MAYNNNHCVLSHDFIGQRFGQGWGWMVLLFHVVLTEIPWWCTVDGSSDPEDPRCLHPHALHVVEDGYRADLPWAPLSVMWSWDLPRRLRGLSQQGGCPP